MHRNRFSNTTKLRITLNLLIPKLLPWSMLLSAIVWRSHHLFAVAITQMVIRFRTYSYICGDHIGYPTNNRLSGLHNQSPQRNEMSKCYIRSTYMVGGWWVVDTIPFQNIYFSTITLGDDLLVLFPANDTEFAISGIIFRMATKSIANTQLVKYLHLFQLPKSILSGNWLSEGGRRDEKERRAAQWWWSANQVACLIYRHPCT